MTLNANRNVDRYVDQELRAFPVAAGVQVFKGALLEVNATGFVQPVSGAAAFAGIAYEEMDNTGGQSGAVSVRVFTQGDFSFPLAGATDLALGQAVYAASDDTLTTSPDGATYVGFVQGVVAAGEIVLRLAALGPFNAATIEHHAATFAVSLRQSGTTFTNLGATGLIIATLSPNAPPGTAYQFVCMADQEFRVKPPALSAIYIKGAKQADNKYVSISDIGDFIHLVADGNGDWVATASISGADADIAVES